MQANFRKYQEALNIDFCEINQASNKEFTVKTKMKTNMLLVIFS